MDNINIGSLEESIINKLCDILGKYFVETYGNMTVLEFFKLVVDKIDEHEEEVTEIARVCTKAYLDKIIFGNSGKEKRVSYRDFYDKKYERDSLKSKIEDLHDDGYSYKDLAKKYGYDINRSTNTRQMEFEFNNCYFTDLSAAEFALDKLKELINNYGRATVADFYDLIDFSTTLKCYDYGWEDLSLVDIIQEGEQEYIIDLPKPALLKLE